MEYNVPIKLGMIPSTLKELTLPIDYNHPLHEFFIINECLYYIPVFPPYGLTKLYITNFFNKPILPNVLPRTLKELKIGTSFTHELYFQSIPDSVTLLNFDCPYYNHQFAPGILPRNLIMLVIGNNVPLLPGSLPESLTYLKLGRHFNHPITPDLLPIHLKKISFGPNFNITKITIESISDTLSIFNYYSPSIIRPNLTSLKFADMDYNVPIKPGMIPSTLRELTLPTDFNHPLHEVFAINNCPYYIPVFPAYGLTKLYITNYFNQPIPPYVLPRTLKELKIGFSFTQELYFESIPDSVTFLTLDCPDYDHQLVPGILPRNLKKLKMRNNVPLLPGSLPESLTYLKLGGHFNHPITPNLLPKSLQKISFGPNFNSFFVPSENVHTIIF
ncbi:hypothetical protein DICPUDRAFT_47250, partial [Dictyostelium purpureum]